MVRNVAPVICMIVIGFLFRKTGFLSEKGINDLKKLASQFMLPVVMFHAFATVTYTREALLVAGCVLVLVAATFFGGYLVRPVFREPYKKYIPFVAGVYESGMIVFPLYMSLFGQENLHHVATLDVGNAVFFASVFLMMLAKAESEEEIKPVSLFLSVLKGPVMVGTLWMVR